MMLARGTPLLQGLCKPLRPTVRQGRVGPRLATRRLKTQCLMGTYQYQRRVQRLKQSGVEVHEFGSRVLKESCYGDDVAALQEFMGEQGYLNCVDGVTGYFGSVTKEAVQNWQRDQGLTVTGVFDSECKWAYLRQQEARVAEMAAPVMAVPTSTPPAPVAPTSSPAVALSWQVGVVGAAALLAGAYLAWARRQRSLADPSLPGGGNPLADLFRSLARAIAALFPPRNDAPLLLAEGSAPHQETVVEGFVPTEEAEEAEEVLLGPGAGRVIKPGGRLSEEELQRRIAAMKGEGPRRSAVQRPPPRPLVDRQPGADPFLESKYGKYYGGRQVLDQVKSFLEEERPPTPTNGPARRMQAMGYPMRDNRSSSRRSRQAGRGSPPQPDQQQAQQQQQQQQAPPSAAARPFNPPAASRAQQVSPFVGSVPQPQQPSFADVEVDTAAANGAGAASAYAPAGPALLEGTELERVAPPPGRPVPVVRPEPRQQQQPAAPGPNGAAAAAGGTTLGDMLRSHADEAAEFDAGGSAEPVPVDPNATVVLKDAPIKIHKPARLARGQGEALNGAEGMAQQR